MLRRMVLSLFAFGYVFMCRWVGDVCLRALALACQFEGMGRHI